jgi:uncharacterized OB-fold protein
MDHTMDQRGNSTRSSNEHQIGLIRCSGCGAVTYPEDRFCACCGTPVERTCAACGAVIQQPVACYCSGCGARLANVL